MRLTKQDINDIMVTALEGGINYWCIGAKPENPQERKDEEYLSDILSKGRDIMLMDEFGKEHFLTLDNFKKGFKMFKENHKGCVFSDAGDIDANDADEIIQYAIFDELVYG